MFAYHGDVAHVMMPDCLKQGVLKCHLYDPNLNPADAQLATDYCTAVVPARAKKPRDNAVFGGLVKIRMRYVHFRYRCTKDQPERHELASANLDSHAKCLLRQREPVRAAANMAPAGLQCTSNQSIRSLSST
jgi:hypothetical protein